MLSHENALGLYIQPHCASLGGQQDNYEKNHIPKDQPAYIFFCVKSTLPLGLGVALLLSMQAVPGSNPLVARYFFRFSLLKFLIDIY